MARIFISHSSANNAEALALRDWLVAHGWDDLFLDIDPQRGLVAGQRWLERLQESAQRCKAVLFVLSRAWLASEHCRAEFREARKQERPLFWLVIDDTAVSEVPAEMIGVWQLTFLNRGSRFETFSVKPPPGYVRRRGLRSPAPRCAPIWRLAAPASSAGSPICARPLSGDFQRMPGLPRSSCRSIRPRSCSRRSVAVIRLKPAPSKPASSSSAWQLRDRPAVLALVTVRSDAYEMLQTAEALAGVPQVPFNLPRHAG